MFRSFLPQGNTPRPRETSRLSSSRDSTSGAQLWKKVGKEIDQAAAVKGIMGMVNKKLAGMQAPGLSGKMHPFKIYQFPDRFRKEALDPNEAWRTFRVRGGCLFLDDARGTFLDVDSNSDGVDMPYEDVFNTKADGSLIDQTSVFEVLCIEDDTTYFWIELDGETPVGGTILSDTNPADNGWGSWPTPDCDHILIGWVDTESRSTERIALVRQVLINDV